METLLSTTLLTLGLLIPLGAAAQQQADAAQPTDDDLREAVRPWKLEPNGRVQKLACPLLENWFRDRSPCTLSGKFRHLPEPGTAS